MENKKIGLIMMIVLANLKTSFKVRNMLCGTNKLNKLS